MQTRQKSGARSRSRQIATETPVAQHSRTPRPRPGRLAGLWQEYADSTPRPLYCLLFLFPLVATHQFGAMLLQPFVWPDRELVAYRLIKVFLSWFGASGFWLPAVALLTTLLVWHLLARQPWRIHGWVLPGMVVESVALTLPLFVMGQLARLAAGGTASQFDLREQIVLVLGAGIYEELVFRLYLLAGVIFALRAGLRIPRRASVTSALVISAVAFAACHFLPIGSDSFNWPQFLLLTTAGVYLGLVFLWRGLGIAAGCHAAFNLVPLLVRI